MYYLDLDRLKNRTMEPIEINGVDYYIGIKVGIIYGQSQSRQRPEQTQENFLKRPEPST